ncbi:MAG: hypothetical protein WCB51_07125 [Candidatus Dormiibacterota bacterium]
MPFADRRDKTAPATDVIVNVPPATRSRNSPIFVPVVEQRSLEKVTTLAQTAGTPGGVAWSPVTPAKTWYRLKLEPGLGPIHWSDVTKSSYESGPTWTGPALIPGEEVGLGTHGGNEVSGTLGATYGVENGLGDEVTAALTGVVGQCGEAVAQAEVVRIANPAPTAIRPFTLRLTPQVAAWYRDCRFTRPIRSKLYR